MEVMQIKINQKNSMGIKIFCFLFGAILFNPYQTWGQEKPVGRIIGIIGTVELLIGEPVAQAKKGEVQQASAEVWEKVKKKQSIYSKDTFRTGRKSRLKILFEDKSLMALGPKTRMSVESYLYKPKDKLRQGVINMAHGLSMYIVNKSQKNKKSSFRIVSPTGNLAARGTQGYISASADKTLIANQAGTVSVSNSDPNVGMERKSNWFEFEEGPMFTTVAFDENTDLFAQALGGGEVAVGAMQKTSILQGQPPSPPVPLTPGELKAIRNVVLAKVGGSSQNKGLIEVKEKKTKKKKKKKKKSEESDESEESSESKESSEETSEESSESEESADSEKSGESEESESKGSEEPAGESTESGDTVESDAPVSGGDAAGGDVAGGDAGFDGGFDSGFMSDFTEAGVPEGSFGTAEDFSGGVDVFDDSSTESCSG
jgi:hypothetical protein